MATKHLRAGEGAPPPGADDLRQIPGIGPVIAGRLYAAGVTTFAKLADLSLDELAECSGGYAVEEWITQAGALVRRPQSPPEEREKTPAPATPERPAGPPAGAASPTELSQRYALFTVKLLFAPDGGVQRMIVTHLPTESDGEVSSQWAGWDGQRLAEFVVERAGLRVAPPAPAPTTDSPVELIQGEIEARALGAEQRQLSMPCSQPFAVHLDLDLREAAARFGHPLRYGATVLARSLGEQRFATLGEAAEQTLQGDTAALSIIARPLPAGIYRLEARVRLSRPYGSAAKPLESVEERLKGSMVELYRG
jgi:hypothetical protein